MTFAVILAAGSSTRFGQDKLSIPLPDGRPLWRASFDTFKNHPLIDAVGIVCGPGRHAQFSGVGEAFTADGGKTRQESARIGVASSPEAAETVLIHDAARPFADGDLITRVIQAAIEHGAAVPAVPVSDTIKRGGEWVEATLDRTALVRAQTPQAARRDWLLEALSAPGEFTDEASALEQAGRRVRIVAGSESNLKVTTPEDLQALQPLYVSATGLGYDIHEFCDEPGRELKLGGVLFPGERPLRGHSDADVVLHALTDALLGSCGLGDIGILFPNDDPSWKDADSMIFLREAVRLLRESGAVPVAADITVLAEFPRVGPRSAEIRERISKEIGVFARNINIKATTMEGLGAIGRGEGIAAMAVATVLRPSADLYRGVESGTISSQR